MRIPERKQHQNRSASCYIFTTQSQPKIYTFGNENMDNCSAYIPLQNFQKKRLFLWGGTSSQFFGASSDYVSEPYVTNFIDLE